MLYTNLNRLIFAVLLLLICQTTVQAQSYLVSDSQLDAIIRVDPVTGNRTVVSGDPTGENIGSGPDLEAPRELGVAADGSIIVLVYLELTTPVILSIDPFTGDRTIISGNGVGNGDPFAVPQSLHIGPDGFIYVGHPSPLILKVDPITGDRTVVTDETTGSGPALHRPNQMTFDAAGQLLVGDGDTIFRVDPVTGDRTIVTSDDGDPGGQVVGTGASIASVGDLVVEQDGTIFVMDGANSVFVRVDPSNGNRTFVTQDGTGPIIQFPFNMVQVSPDQITVVDFILDAVILFDKITRNRTVISDNNTVGTGILFDTPLYIAFEPALNFPPAATDDQTETFEGIATTIPVLDNDNDPEEEPLTVTGVTQGSNGSVAIDEGDLTVTYTPDEGFTGTDTFTYDVSDGTRVSTATVTVTVDPLPRLKFSEVFVAPGDQAVVRVTLEVPEPVSNILFELEVQPSEEISPDLVQYSSGFNHVSNLGFLFSDNTGTGDVTRITLNTLDDPIPVGETVLLDLTFNIDEATPAGGTFDLDITGNFLTTPDIQDLPHQVETKLIRVGQPGDITLDGQINILDIARIVRTILHILPSPLGFDLYLADVNTDEIIDIRDAITMVNLFLFGEPVPPLKASASPSPHPVVAKLGDIVRTDDARLAIPLVITRGHTIAGIQAKINLVPGSIAMGAPEHILHATGFQTSYYSDSGTLRIVSFSPDGRTLTGGSDATFLIPITLNSGELPEFTLEDVILADRYGNDIPVRIEQNQPKATRLPDSFMVHSAYPNPFNPSTTIAYEVPKRSHIQIVVYNLMGQEVMQLVDQQQNAGRYEVVWNARNAQGLPVASGIYVYRLISSTGYSESRRMTLLK